MPSGSKKTKEDTWTEKELTNAIQGDKKEKKHRSRDKESKDSSKEKEKRSERHKEDRDGKERKNKRHEEEKDVRGEDKESKERRRHRDKERENGENDKKESERKHGSKEKHDEDRKDKHKDREKDHSKESDRERRHKDKNRERREKTDKADDKREHREDKKERREDRKEHREDRKERKDDKKERREDRREDREKEKERDKNKEKDREQKKHREHDNDKEKKKNSDETDDLRDREKEERRRRKHRDEDSAKERHKSKESRSSSGRDRKHRESSGKSRDDKERNKKEKEIEKRKAKEIEKQKQLEQELELKRLAEEEEKRKKEEEEANEEYDDDFDEYDDDDFEDDFEDDSEEEKENHNENGEEEESSLNNDNNNKKHKDEITSDNEKMEHQKSYLKMSKSEEEGLNEVMQAISAENEKAANNTRIPKDEAKKVKKKETIDDESPPKKVYGKINFVAANKKQINEKVAQRTKKRGEELLQLVQLDVRSIDLFDLPPMTEYELYMKRFGSSDSKQMFTQTNDECYDKEIQTDDIETETRWCQHSSEIKSAGTKKSSSTETKNSLDSILNADSARLNKFLMRASKVCLSLLEEIEAGIEQPRKQYVETRTSFSDGYVSLGSSEFLVLGRDVCDMTYSPTQTNMLLTAHGASNVVMKDLKSSKGLLCVWNTNEPTKPTKLLICESVPKSCCFGSGSASFAFAGMEDGVVAVWDLNEPSFYHETCQIGNSLLIFQTVTFTTAALPEKHNFPVVAITPLTSSTGSSENNDSMDLSFQLATMDQSASVHIWILVRTQGIQAYDITSVNEDLGLSPNGRVKLVHSAVINPPGASVSSFTHLFTMTCLSVEQGDSNHMYAGTQQGDILHLARFGNRPTPKVYRSGGNGGSYKVNAIDVCPWKTPYMLACYDDGCVRLFHLKTEHALMTWPNTKNGVALIDVKWSQSKPSVFYTIDSESVLYAWNLLESDIAPIFQLKIQRKDKRAIGFALANDYSASGRGSPGRSPELALIFGDGSVEIHRLNKALATMSASEWDEMELFLLEIT